VKQNRTVTMKISSKKGVMVINELNDMYLVTCYQPL